MDFRKASNVTCFPGICETVFSELRRLPLRLLAIGFVLLSAGGCTSLSQWWHQGLKVGPDYCPPTATVADQWIDAGDGHVVSDGSERCQWWQVFNDATLEQLVLTAYEQNLTLQAAGLRVLEERAQRQVAAGNLFPQSQTAFGNYTRQQFSRGKIDYDRVFILEANFVRLQDRLVNAQADAAIGLVRVYKAMGGGWELRCADAFFEPPAEMLPPVDQEELPSPESVPAPEAPARTGLDVRS